MVFGENKRKRNYNFLQLVYREVKEILLLRLKRACFFTILYSVILLCFPKGQLSTDFRGIMGQKCWLKVGKKYIKECYLF